MKMWEIRESQEPKHDFRSSMRSYKKDDEDREREIYECGYEDGYKDAYREAMKEYHFSERRSGSK